MTNSVEQYAEWNIENSDIKLQTIKLINQYDLKSGDPSELDDLIYGVCAFIGELSGELDEARTTIESLDGDIADLQDALYEAEAD